MILLQIRKITPNLSGVNVGAGLVPAQIACKSANQF
jgi:hypothetical protein